MFWKSRAVFISFDTLIAHLIHSRKCRSEQTYYWVLLVKCPRNDISYSMSTFVVSVTIYFNISLSHLKSPKIGSMECHWLRIYILQIWLNDILEYTSLNLPVTVQDLVFVFLFCWFKTLYSVSKRTALLHIKERLLSLELEKTNSTLNTKRDVYNLFKWREPLNHLTVKAYEFMGVCSSQNPISTVYMYAS